MREKLKLIWKKLKVILKDKSGEGDIEIVKNIIFTPLGYKFLKNNIEKYSVQIGMLNQLLNVTKQIIPSCKSQIKIA